MIQQFQFLCKSIQNPHRDVVWFDGKEMGHSIMTNYQQNAMGEASNMFHWMSSFASTKDIWRRETLVYTVLRIRHCPQKR